MYIKTEFPWNLDYFSSYFIRNGEKVDLIESGILSPTPPDPASSVPLPPLFPLSLCIAIDSFDYFLVELNT